MMQETISVQRSRLSYFLEYCGTCFSITGATLMVLPSGWMFVVFFVASVLFGTFAWHHKYWGMLVMQLFFGTMHAIGMYRFFSGTWGT